MIEILAEATQTVSGMTGNIHIALGCLGAALSVGLVGAKTVEAVSRNPSASGPIFTLGILGMALAEAVAFYVIFLAK